jgi:hypothetical protein
MSVDLYETFEIKHFHNNKGHHDYWDVDLHRGMMGEPDDSMTRRFEGEDARERALAFLLSYLAPMPNKNDKWKTYGDDYDPDEDNDEALAERAEALYEALLAANPFLQSGPAEDDPTDPRTAADANELTYDGAPY